MNRLLGKVAIVTGASSGIGATTASMLASEGASVVLADINESGASAQAEKIASEGGRCCAIQFDLREEASVASMVEQAVAEFGGIDVLHNNAAATHLPATVDYPVLEADPAVWALTMQVNLCGTMLVTKHAAPHMIARGGGSIINMSSGAALFGDRIFPAYGASKAGIIALTKYSATQLGKQGVRVNAIVPGLIVTEATLASGHADSMADMMLRNNLVPRLGDPRDIAHAVVFLASDESTFITGQTIGVDGGMHSHAPYFGEQQQ